MKAYFQLFVNFEQNDWIRLFPMVEFAYNNAKNANTSHILFKLNYRYYPCISYKENLDPRSMSTTAKKLFFELRNLMAIYQQNLYHA